MLTHCTTTRVIYGDTDRMGYAYNANYLRWFEIGRAELFRFLGMTYKQIEERGIFLPVSEVFCKFISPVAYDDILQIEATIDLSVKGGVKIDYLLNSEDGRQKIAEGYTKHACVNSEGRVVRPPRFLIDFLSHTGENGVPEIA